MLGRLFPGRVGAADVSVNARQPGGGMCTAGTWSPTVPSGEGLGFHHSSRCMRPPTAGTLLSSFSPHHPQQHVLNALPHGRGPWAPSGCRLCPRGSFSGLCSTSRYGWAIAVTICLD